jgi:glycosyltransferase involved in cell wall biosynthesis
MQNNSKKIKVLVLSHISELLGGAERSMLDVFDHWAKHYGVEPEFILREPVKSLAPALDARGWKYHALRYTFWSDSKPPVSPQDILTNAAYNGRAIQSIQKIIAQSKPDIVMTNSIVCPWAALAAHYQRVPHVWFAREYGDLDHGRIFEIGRQQTWQDIGNLSDLVVTISKSLAEHVAQYVPAQKVAILYNPFAVDEIRTKAAKKVASPFTSSSSLKTVLLGNVAASKGHLEAVKAVAELNKRGLKTELCLIGQAGEADLMNEINKIIAKNNLADKIHFTGHQMNPMAYIMHADVGIMASKREGFGRVTFEYLALGKPVVGANSGATPEMVIDGQTGFLFDPGSVDSLVAALSHYAKDQNLIKTHGQNAGNHAERMMHGPHNIDALFQKIAAIAAKGQTTAPQPINFTHRWLEYVEIADKALKSETLSIKKILKLRLRQKAKPVYYKLRSLKTKALGK